VKVVFCISWFWPRESGAERQARRQAVELARRGHRVSVLTRALPDRPCREEHQGIEIVRAVCPRELGPLFGVTFLVHMRRALLQLATDADIVHCHQSLWEAAASGWARPRLRCPTLVQPAASGPYGEYRQWQRTRGRRLLRRWILRNDCFVAISNEIREELIEFGVCPERVRLIGSGIDTDEFSPGESPLEQKLPPRPRVIFTGRLHPQKNLDVLLHAWRQVVRRVPASLILVGAGPEEARLRALSDKLGVAASVLFAGAQTDVVPYLRAADVFVLPSVAEGMSNALLEAMAAGLAVAVSRIGGNTDLVSEGQTGLLFDPTDTDELAQKLLCLLRNAEVRRRLGRAARRFVVERYSLRSVVDAYERLYRELIAKGSRH